MYRSDVDCTKWKSIRTEIRTKVLRLIATTNFGYSAEQLSGELFWDFKPKSMEASTATHNELTMVIIDILNELNEEGRLLIHKIEMFVFQNREFPDTKFKLKI